MEKGCEYFINFVSQETKLDYSVCNGAFVNGCLHWVVFRKPVSDGWKLIVSFNLATGLYNVVSWPESCCGSLDCEVYLSVLEGCLMVQASSD